MDHSLNFDNITTLVNLRTSLGQTPAKENWTPSTSKTLKNVSTQTKKPAKKSKITYNREVESISDHKTEGAKMGVRFLVKWKGFKIETYERLNDIAQAKGIKILGEYLLKIQKENNRKFKYMLANEPALEDLLKE